MLAKRGLGETDVSGGMRMSWRVRRGTAGRRLLSLSSLVEVVGYKARQKFDMAHVVLEVLCC